MVGGAPLLQTERSSVQTVVQMEQIRELPLSTRNPVVLVNLVPGLRFTGAGGPERGSTVQGFGLRENQTEFQLDGLNANAAMDEGGITIPNVDTIAEFSVETSSFSAENGRNPLQIVMATKSGTNAFHGTAWEFDAERQVQREERLLDGRAAEAESEPVRRRGRRSDRPEQDVLLRQLRGHADPAGAISTTLSWCSRRCSQGDFSGLPAGDHGTPRPGSRSRVTSFPADRISSASRFFFPYLLTPNSPDGRFRAVAPVTDDTYQYTARDRSPDHGRTAHLWPVGDELQRERLAGLLARRPVGERDHAAQYRRSTTRTR